MTVRKRSNGTEERPGVGVDSRGGSVVDPTKNVLDLVEAGNKYQDSMREARAELAKAEQRRTDDLSEAERRRIDGLAELRREYDTRIAEDLRVGVKTTSEQLASQLIKETGSLSNLIGALRTEFAAQVGALTTSFTNQLMSGINALTPRIADLERFRWESGGKTSIADPVAANAMTRMEATISALATTIANLQKVENTSGGEHRGSDKANANLMNIILVIAAVAGPIIAVATTIAVMRGH